MSTIRNGLALALLVGATACYQESAYAQGSPTMPQQDPQTMQGPPGGGMDPGYGYPPYQAPQQDPNEQAPGYTDQVPQQPVADPSVQVAEDPNAAAEPVDPDYGTQQADDATIDTTLEG